MTSVPTEPVSDDVLQNTTCNLDVRHIYLFNKLYHMRYVFPKTSVQPGWFSHKVKLLRVSPWCLSSKTIIGRAWCTGKRTSKWLIPNLASLSWLLVWWCALLIAYVQSHDVNWIKRNHAFPIGWWDLASQLWLDISLLTLISSSWSRIWFGGISGWWPCESWHRWNTI